MDMTLFIWIPKTAGTSILTTYPYMRIFLGDYKDFNNDSDATFGHYDVRLLLKAGIISQQYWQQAYKFTIVRNPYDRFISLFNDFKRSGRVEPKMSEVKFAHMLLQMTRKPGLYNTLDFSQCASQADWVIHGVEVKKFEELPAVTPHLNRSNRKVWQKYYNTELAELVTELYKDDFVLFNYEMI
jgi:hypothetical protein